MRILLKVGQTDYVLANGPELGPRKHMGPQGLGHRRTVAAQIDELLRKDFVQPKSRGNKRRTFRFTISVYFDTMDEANTYSLIYPDSVPEQGELRMIITKPDNSEVVKKILQVVIPDIDIQPRGVTLDITYTIIGGQILDA